MIKKIQQYLLTHHPLIWNIKLIPVLLVILAINLLFFCIGYLSTDLSFTRSYYSYSFVDNESLYAAAILIGILIFIGWLIFYKRNNAFKIYYPRKVSKVFLEWLLIFFIISGITMIPNTLTKGAIEKWNSVETLDSAKKALTIIQKADILIPSRLGNHKYDSDYNHPIAIPNSSVFSIDSLNTKLYSFEYNDKAQLMPTGYTGPSLLFNNSYRHLNYYDNETDDPYPNQSQVYKWLINQDRDKIYGLMKDYFKLLEKHNISVNITPEQWLNRVYNPPFYPVQRENIILSDPTAYNYYDEDKYIQYPPNTPYLLANDLRAGYDKVIRSHTNDHYLLDTIQAGLCVALALSVLVFSWRVTSGKHWLIGFILTGILIFISCLTFIILSESIAGYRSDTLMGMFVFLFWLGLFLAILCHIISKIKNKKSKGHSSTLINLFIWFIPCLCPFLFAITHLYLRYISDDYMPSEYTEYMFWVNIPISIVLMWFACILVRRWKSMPDE